MPRVTIPKLPQLLDRKIYKSGQTRGADDDVIYQNRVGRNSTVLIPYQFWNEDTRKKVNSNYYENGYIVLISPDVYFSFDNPAEELKNDQLFLGENCLVFYETRAQWNNNNPTNIGWVPANNRTAPLGGQYVARVPATTALKNGQKINQGFTLTSKKGAGIRLYEYASSETIKDCRLQLEAVFWLCSDSIESVVEFGISRDDALLRRELKLEEATNAGLLDYDKLQRARIINKNREAVCPLCLKPLSSYGFFNRLSQAEGREVPDLTVTELNLFHIDELRNGVYNHKPYNLGWGHHHCNVVVKDSGIENTLEWMKEVIARNEQ